MHDGERILTLQQSETQTSETLSATTRGCEPTTATAPKQAATVPLGHTCQILRRKDPLSTILPVVMEPRGCAVLLLLVCLACQAAGKIVNTEVLRRINLKSSVVKVRDAACRSELLQVRCAPD